MSLLPGSSKLEHNCNSEDQTFAKMEHEEAKTRLNFLLEKTGLYADFVLSKMEKNSLKREADRQKEKKKTPAKRKRAQSKKSEENEMLNSKSDIKYSHVGIEQPALVTGAVLRDYQLKGVEWLVNLYENGMQGILADEMGLGKTLQTISLFAYLVAKGVHGPFLVVGPLSTLSNWISEFERFTPDLPTLLYHGSIEEREQLRKKHLRRKVSAQFPIIVTSYDIIIRDSKYLQRFQWKYIVVDEGHRLKNLNCRLIRELKQFKSANRLLLTGTPLQNNIRELWSLLNFILPEIFDDLAHFEQWFDFEADLKEHDGDARVLAKQEQQQIVSKLHKILKPFVLRRLKADVMLTLPPKKEVLVACPLAPQQRKLYEAALCGRLREYLEEQGATLDALTGRSVSLHNVMMQLRKACNHPFLYHYPEDHTQMLVTDERIVEHCGKMQILDRILRKLKDSDHKVVLFSQMVRQLDILEDYCAFRGYNFCRLDGSVDIQARKEAIDSFNTDPSVFLFLVSTRAGGLGVNLTAADTVIIYDSDWNPQVDLQAQDRCHRIGQTRPVLVLRLTTTHTVEEQILRRAEVKRKLERLVVARGQFVDKKAQVAEGLEPMDLRSILEGEKASYWSYKGTAPPVEGVGAEVRGMGSGHTHTPTRHPPSTTSTDGSILEDETPSPSPSLSPSPSRSPDPADRGGCGADEDLSSILTDAHLDLLLNRSFDWEESDQDLAECKRQKVDGGVLSDLSNPSEAFL